MEYFTTIKDFLFSPGKAFETVRGTSTKQAFLYLLAMLAILSLLSGAVHLFLSQAPFPAAVAGTSAFATDLLVNILLGLWVHLWAFAFGARGTGETLKAVFYSFTPSALLGWLAAPEFLFPGNSGFYLTLLLALWSAVLLGIGLKKLHSLPGRKAAAVVILSYLVGSAILVGFALYVTTIYYPLLFSIASGL